MSRCYQFPPPGYVRNGIRDEALIESIKREDEKVKKERKKERKREKKEKKRKERETGEDGSKKHSHKRRRKDDNTKDTQKVVNNHKILVDNETELLEKSCLTDERVNQAASQNSCDSTINSSERPSQSPPLDGKHITSESIIRIRLPVKRQKDPEVLTSKDEQPNHFRGRVEASPLAPRELVDQLCLVSASVAVQHALSATEETMRTSLSDSPRHIAMRLGNENMPSTSCSLAEQPMARVREEKPCSTREDTVKPSAPCTICHPKVAAQFLDLIDNWAPPDPVERELVDSDDQEWWFNKPNSRNIGTERCQVSSLDSTSQGSSSTQWPSARFLPGADIHALPYTIPF